MAPKIHQVSSERIREELSDILTEGQAARGIGMLASSGLLSELLPEVAWSGHLEDCLKMLKPASAADFALAVLLHETAVRKVQGIVERLKCSRAEMHHVIALVENLPAFTKIRRMSLSSLKRFFRIARFEDYLELARIHLTAAGEDLDDYRFAARKHQEWSDEDIAPRALITGEDLIGMGFIPGPMFKEILTRVEDEQLEGRLADRAQTLAFVRKNYGGNGR
jgi:poly(A) polymerase